MASHMQRTMRWIEEEKGWINHWVVERFNQYSGKKTDLFHIIDLVVATPKGIIGVQSCGQDFAAHVKKIQVEELYFTRIWFTIPKAQLWLIGWRKLRTKTGTKAVKYYPRVGRFKMSKKGTLTFKEFPTVK